MSTDRTKELIFQFISDYPELKISYILNEKKIASIGMNLGIKNAKGDIIFIFSAHAYMPPDFIEKNVSCHIEYNAEVTGGLILSVGNTGTYLARAIGFALNKKFSLGGITARTGTEVAPLENPSFGGYRKYLFDKFGLLDESLIKNSDYEFNLRINRQYVKMIFSPEIKSYYHNRESFGELFRQYYLSSFYKALMIGKYEHIIRFRHLIPSLFIILMFFLLIVGIFEPLFIVLFTFIGLIYVLTSILSSINKPQYIPVITLIFLTIHFSYGIGFIFGLARLVFSKNRKKK